ncbi:MAG: alpha/beta fold hydrolase [Pseudomonadota bacterium]
MIQPLHQAMMSIGDVTLNVRRQGDPANPMILFLHGFPEYSGMWARLMEMLSDRFFCVAPDQRGYATSSKPEGVENYAAGKIAGDAIGLIEQLSPEQPVYLVGHDWGASVAYAAAIMRPDLLQGLIIVNGVHAGPFQHALLTDPAQVQASQYMHKLRAPEAEGRFSADGFALLFKMFAAFSDLSWMTEDERQSYVEAWSPPGALTGMLNWYRASPVYVPTPGEDTLARENPFSDTAKLRVRPRHLLIWGQRDAALLPSCYARLGEYCDDLKVVEIADADHWVVNAKPDLVAETIRSFIDGQVS